MPTLILARHAKAEAPRPGMSDRDRALSLEGRDQAAALAERLVEGGWVPEVALVSSANRTLQTFRRMATVLDSTALRAIDELYECAPARYLGVLTAVGSVGSVMVVGHEPTTSAVAASLAGPGSEKAALQKVALGMSTASAAVFEFDGDWAELGPKKARLMAVVRGAS